MPVDKKDLIPMRRKPKKAAKRGPPPKIPVCWHCPCGQTTPAHINFCGRCGEPISSAQKVLWPSDVEEMVYRNITRRS